MNLIRSLTVGAVAIALALPSSARADGKAWAAIQARLPAGVIVAGGVNMSKVRASKIYKTALPALLTQDKDSKDVISSVKATCKIDLLAAIDDAAFAMENDDKGVIAIGLAGVDEAKFDACLIKIARAKENVTITTARAGDVVEYTASGEPEKLYIAWLATDVIAIATHPSDKALLAALVGGKGAGAHLVASIAKANTKDAVWAAMADLPAAADSKMTAAYGSIALASGKIAIGGHFVMSSSADATALANDARRELADVGKRVPAALQKIVKSIGISTSGSDVVLAAALPDSSFADLVKLFDKMF